MGSAGTKRKDYFVKLHHVWKGNHWEPAIVVTDQRHVDGWREPSLGSAAPYSARALRVWSVRAHSKEEAIALALASETGHAPSSRDAYIIWEKYDLGSTSDKDSDIIEA